MSEPDGAPRFRRPARLSFEPEATAGEPEQFFALETVTDPHELLHRATDLAVAFRTAADRATEYQAVAAAQLADPARFDRLPPATIADRAGWSEDYAHRMIAYGRELQTDPSGPGTPPR